MSDFSTSPPQRDFRCNHCNGKILIPYNLPSTTGPCPHCSGTITSPPPPEANIPPPAQQAAPSHSPIAPSPAATTPVEPAAAAVTPVAAPAAKAPRARKSSSGLIPAMLGLLFLSALGGAAVWLISQQMGTRIDPPNLIDTTEHTEIQESNYIRVGWQRDAYRVLADFIDASSSEEKLPHINRVELLDDQIRAFYGGVVIDDSDTPAEAFAVFELSEEDRRRGIFMMVYDRPPQVEMKEFFRPLASLEVQYGIDEADLLLSTIARIGNFAMEPVRVHAFFKRTTAGLKLDWEMFVQTKYRRLRNFIELPEIGLTETFRVFVVEDVPERGTAVAGSRTYLIADPANTIDTTRINVRVDSEPGRALSIINWRGTDDNTPITRTATLELEWVGTPEKPEIEIKRFICWEFLGLGGQEVPATASNR